MGCSSSKVVEEKVEEEVIPEPVYDESIEINLNENPFAQNLFNNNPKDNFDDIPVDDERIINPMNSKGGTLKSIDSNAPTLKSTTKSSIKNNKNRRRICFYL